MSIASVVSLSSDQSAFSIENTAIATSSADEYFAGSFFHQSFTSFLRKSRLPTSMKKVDVFRRSRKLQESPEIIKVEGNHATTKHHPQKRIRKLDYLPVRFLIHFRKHGIPGVIIIHRIKSVCHRFQRLQQT